MSFGILLVHGYTGSSDDFMPLIKLLGSEYGYENILKIDLPGHGPDKIPLFDENLFIESISTGTDALIQKNKDIIFIGHSTGGSLILNYLEKKRIKPLSIILASTPKKIGPEYLSRWEKHLPGIEIPLTDIAKMVSSINKSSKSSYDVNCPALIIQGESDELVPCREALSWEKDSFKTRPQIIAIPSAGHNIFSGPGGDMAAAVIKRYIKDIEAYHREKKCEHLETIINFEPDIKKFLSSSPVSAVHILRSPAGQKLYRKTSQVEMPPDNDPVFANIEISTNCNMKCRYCCRTIHGRTGKNMDKDIFKNILRKLPNCYHITLVGLGEPLLNPGVTDIVSIASGENRKISLVTNGMLLNETVSRELIDAGLNSITFSIDAPDQDIAEKIRPGSDMKKIIENINIFMDINNSAGKIPTAVFSALSIHNVTHIKDLIEIITRLKTDALMLTDLNFMENINDSIWNNIDDVIKTKIRNAIARAFAGKLPVLSVRGLEEFGISARYKDYLLLPPNLLWTRSRIRTGCFSPWQTIPVNVDGDVYICDCQPQKTIGNILDNPLSCIWNCDEMKALRSDMLTDDPPPECLICPRF